MPFDKRDFLNKRIGSSKKRLIEMQEEIRYTDPKTKRVFVVPVGFRSDYGSVPRILHSIFPPDEYPAEYVLHDLLYSGYVLKRTECDRVLRTALKDIDVRWTRRHAIWFGTRMGGWAAWDDKTGPQIMMTRNRILTAGGVAHWDFIHES